MDHKQAYDVAIAGGGLAGLSAAILLCRAGHRVVLLEKEHYPFHRVCGEYVSKESWNFLERLGLDLQTYRLPSIDRLFLTAPNGRSFRTSLPLGGFGISRHLLDASLAQLARKAGLNLLEGAKVEDINFDGKLFHLKSASQEISARVCLAATGKRSNLDLRWDRAFLRQHDKRLDNYVGIKYHVRTDWEEGTIGLHNFLNGYCGISRIENDRHCVCYMTRAENLKMHKGNIRAMEENILFRNPHLKRIFSSSSFAEEFPVSIAQISFVKKTQVETGVLMLGDAAGMITPLCGNGMSIALHTGKLAAEAANEFLTGKNTRDRMEDAYRSQWHSHFAGRLRTGRTLQRFFGSPALSNVFVSSFRLLPFLAKPVVKLTHGQAF